MKKNEKYYNGKKGTVHYIIYLLIGIYMLKMALSNFLEVGAVGS